MAAQIRIREAGRKNFTLLPRSGEAADRGNQSAESLPFPPANYLKSTNREADPLPFSGANGEMSLSFLSPHVPAWEGRESFFAPGIDFRGLDPLCVPDDTSEYSPLRL